METREQQVIRELNEVYKKLLSIELEVRALNEQKQFDCCTHSGLNVINSIDTKVSDIVAKIG